MHHRTTATLESLRAVDWFRNVGIQGTDGPVILSSWKAAIESCGSMEWENLCLEAANQYRERLLERSRDEFRRWNEVVEAIKPSAEALVLEKTQRVIADHHLPTMFLDTVKWDILHLFMECEFADTYQPGFYASQAYWYREGRFPCGWDGAFPDGGRLIIY